MVYSESCTVIYNTLYIKRIINHKKETIEHINILSYPIICPAFVQQQLFSELFLGNCSSYFGFDCNGWSSLFPHRSHFSYRTWCDIEKLVHARICTPSNERRHISLDLNLNHDNLKMCHKGNLFLCGSLNEGLLPKPHRQQSNYKKNDSTHVKRKYFEMQKKNCQT